MIYLDFVLQFIYKFVISKYVWWKYSFLYSTIINMTKFFFTYIYKYILLYEYIVFVYIFLLEYINNIFVDRISANAILTTYGS